MTAKRIWLAALALGIVSLAGLTARATDPLVVVFHQEGCPDCAFMQTVLDGLVTEHSDLTIAYHETSEPGASGLLLLLYQKYGPVPATMPIIFVGDRTPIVGAGRAQELALREAVAACLTAGCPSPMERATGLAIPWPELLIAGGLVLGFLLVILLLHAI
jgi:hypothetical protein